METTLDDYWTRSVEIGRLPLPPRDDERDLSFIWHQSREDYRAGHREIGITLHGAGERVYVHAKAVFYSPNIVLTVALTPPVPSDLGEEIGHVIDAEQQGQQRHEVASCQAWYYERECVLMMWEVDMRTHYQESDDPTQDFVLSSVWQAFERALLEEFPDCERVITPGWDPGYDGEQFRAFLQRQGYAPHIENTFIKTINAGAVENAKLERLCEECGEPTGATFYIVEIPLDLFSDETKTEAVCHDCYEEGKDDWLSAELHAETEAALQRMQERIKAAFPQEY